MISRLEVKTAIRQYNFIAAEIARACVNFTLGAEQDASRVHDLLECMPDAARGMKIEVSFTDQ
jgi:hypothetical protein